MLNKLFKLRHRKRHRCTISSLIKNKDGVSAVEFALVAPFMLILLYGSVEIAFLMQADRRITTVTATVGDLVSRTDTIDQDGINGVFEAADLLISPLNPQGSELIISSLVASANGDVTVDWSRAQGTAPRAQGSSVSDLPNGLVPDGGSIIFAEGTYNYESPIGFIDFRAFGFTESTLNRDRRLSDVFYVRPRRSNRVEFDNG